MFVDDLYFKLGRRCVCLLLTDGSPCKLNLVLGTRGSETVLGGLGNSLSFGGVTLTTKSGVRSLGIHLDPALTMDTQVVSVVHRLFASLVDSPAVTLSQCGGAHYLGTCARNFKIIPL